MPKPAPLSAWPTFTTIRDKGPRGCRHPWFVSRRAGLRLAGVWLDETRASRGAVGSRRDEKRRSPWRKGGVQCSAVPSSKMLMFAGRSVCTLPGRSGHCHGRRAPRRRGGR
eukprot:7253544-Pyramimonas_sp.AAC.1